MLKALCTTALMSALLFTAPAVAGGHGEKVVTSQHDYELVKVASGLEHPWGLDWLPDGTMIVTERPGRIRIVDENGKISEPISGVPALVSEFRDGLLDVSVSPNFASDSTIFFAYSQKEGAERWLEVASASLKDNALSDLKVIYKAGVKVEKDQGFGSRIRFDANGNLVISVGDHAAAKNAQDTSNTLGSIIRITPTGEAVADNPGGNLHASIFAYGFKNPQGLTISSDGTIWAVDHGGAGGGELNRVAKGGNYGWPTRTFSGGDAPRAEKAFESIDPAFTWGVAPTVALSGLEHYSGTDFPNWTGDLFAGSLTQEALIRIMLDDNGSIVGTEYVIDGQIGRIREVRQGPDGMLYVLNDDPEGGIYRLEAHKH